MKIASFSAQEYDKEYLDKANQKYNFDITYFKEILHENNVQITKGFDVITAFTSDKLNENVLKKLKQNNIKVVAMRCTGINNVDILAAKNLGIKVARVPGYSPHSVAEFTIGLLITSIRHIHQAVNRVRDLNFSLNGLLGTDLYQKTVGIIGLGKIGKVVFNLLKAFGCKVLASDPYVKDEDIEKTDLATIYKNSDIITFHCSLTKENKHMVNKNSLAKMKDGVILVNTARGALFNTEDIIEGIKSKKISYLAIDVYEEEENFFLKDLSSSIIYDDIFARLLTFPNVLVTAHQAFFTNTALKVITETTLESIFNILNNKECKNLIGV